VAAAIVGICGIDLRRDPDFRWVTRAGWEDIAFGHDTDYGSWLLVDLNLLTDDV
jgi:hypothetical protein